MRSSRSKVTTPPLNQVTNTRALLQQVLAKELPALEQAIAARDFDRAVAYGAIVRSARQQVRSLLAGGDPIGTLRAEWTKAEARLDAALVASPRPNADPESARRQWNQRLARGTGSPRARPTAKGSAPAWSAVSDAIDEDVYFAPEGSDTVDTVDEPITPNTTEPPTIRQVKRPRR